jgi:hypothetical protein
LYLVKGYIQRGIIASLGVICSVYMDLARSKAARSDVGLVLWGCFYRMGLKSKACKRKWSKDRYRVLRRFYAD